MLVDSCGLLKAAKPLNTSPGVVLCLFFSTKVLKSQRQSVRRSIRLKNQSSRRPCRPLAHFGRCGALRAQHLACACDMESLRSHSGARSVFNVSQNVPDDLHRHVGTGPQRHNRETRWNSDGMVRLCSWRKGTLCKLLR